MEDFVHKHSIVRKIWGRSDTILFIFAGSAAEFAVNKSVDWLYFTGRLPADPIARLFSTVEYSRQIIFAPEARALAAIDAITGIHKGVEQARGARIPQWAYRDVLFMLIYYSIQAYKLLYRPLTDEEKEEVLRVFLRVGERMGIEGLPRTYAEWSRMHKDQLLSNTTKSSYSIDLYKQYRLHLGAPRYQLLIQLQIILVPARVRTLLFASRRSVFPLLILFYKISKKIKADRFVRYLLLPSRFRRRIEMLDQEPSV